MAIELARYLSDQLARLPKDHPDRKLFETDLARVAKYNERKNRSRSTETPSTEAPVFTERTRETLEAAGALIYDKKGESIEDQLQAGRNFWHVVDVDRVRKTPSTFGQVAIFPTRHEFFLQGSFNRSLPKQLMLAEADAVDLRERLGDERVDIVIPKVAADITDVTFQHLDATGQRLFGNEFDLLYGRTQMPTTGSVVASVGYFGADDGPSVHDWFAGSGSPRVGAVRWVVPK
ncbi:hypothetical protein HYT33_01985 [Candidatus Roizmanbacteria bacterium]|nr:hypothetical protein [Candidatus Roizmanbacteria bacterium]